MEHARAAVSNGTPRAKNARFERRRTAFRGSIADLAELSVDDRANDNGTVQRDPTHAWQVDILVAFLDPEPKPEKC